MAGWPLSNLGVEGGRRVGVETGVKVVPGMEWKVKVGVRVFCKGRVPGSLTQKFGEGEPKEEEW